MHSPTEHSFAALTPHLERSCEFRDLFSGDPTAARNPCDEL